jgi:hypothetical protein
MTSCLLAVLAFGAAPASGQTATHVFDPQLSLRGDCGTDSLDLIPDPGCPYPSSPGAPQTFNPPFGAVTDSAGDIYVLGGEDASGPNQRIYVFDASGHWILTESKTELIESLAEEYAQFKEPKRMFLRDIAVDSLGNLYIAARGELSTGIELSVVVRYTPSSYPPDKETTYTAPFVSFENSPPLANFSLALDSLDRLYVNRGSDISIYSSAASGNEPIAGGSEIGAGLLSSSVSMDIGPGPSFDIYASTVKPGASPIPTPEEPFVSQIVIFDGLETGPGGAAGALKGEIDGSDTPNCAVVEGKKECGFSSSFGALDIAVERTNRNVYVSDSGSKAVYEFLFDEGAEEYSFLSKIERSFQNRQVIALDNSSSSLNQGHLFVTSQASGIGHLYAFKPLNIGPPIVTGQAVSGLSTTEALLEANVNPGGAATRYSFQYVEEATYLDDVDAAGPGHGFDHAIEAPVPHAVLAAADEPIAVSSPLTGLLPATTYRFRLVAENCDPAEPEREQCTSQGEGKPGEEGDDARFATYPSPSNPAQCPNEARRTGRSAALPDCRAYELVTPPDTNGLPPLAFSIGGAGAAAAWSAPLGAPTGESVLFLTGGGSLPGHEGSGALNSDGYRAKRDPSSGWRTEAAGPSGAQAPGPAPGSHSPDHDYWAWTFLSEPGSAAPDANYLRGPDHSFELVGMGTLAPEGDPEATPRWISPGGDHIVFSSKVRLEEDAPPVGTTAIYDRSADGPTRVVSLLPGDLIPGGGENASYQGASADGTTVAFTLNGTLYARVDNAQTLEVTSEEAIFAGLSHDGRWLFYLRPTEGASGIEPARGDLFAFDTVAGQAAEIGSGGKSIPVNVSADGSTVYFVSSEQLDGAEGEAGKDNLYRWDAETESIRFIAVLLHVDVTGDDLGDGKTAGGLGLWTSHAVNPDQHQFRGRSSNPSRTTPDGSVLLFESRADLTETGSVGHREIYRYDAVVDNLACLSCDPTLVQPPADSKLVLLFDEGGVLNPLAELANLSVDGKRAFFESVAALVPADVNETRDVYEWRAQGMAACGTPSGCLALISSGQGASPSYLYGASSDGSDVFIWTKDILLPADKDETASVYDARANGGFLEAQLPPCEDDGCRPRASAPLSLPGAGSATFQGSGNVRGPRHCPKGKRKVRRAGRIRCVKKKGDKRPRQGERGRSRRVLP